MTPLVPRSIGEYLEAIPLSEREGNWRWLASAPAYLRQAAKIIDFRYSDGTLGDDWEPIGEDPERRAWLVRRAPARRRLSR